MTKRSIEQLGTGSTYATLLPMLTPTPRGLYCPTGDFYIDPLLPVERAVITHAHGDHARPGSRRYLAAREGERLLRRRLGKGAKIETVAYGAVTSVRDVRVSLHPAGHILGSAQVRLEHRGEVWVVSGDYKLAPDPTCKPFEPVRCHTFVTETTFAEPSFVWRDAGEIFEELRAWWRANQEAGQASVVFAYSLGKAQRLLAALREAPGPIFCHPTPYSFAGDYRAEGVALAGCQRVDDRHLRCDWGGSLVIAPPSAYGTPWTRRFSRAATARVSGWGRTSSSAELPDVDCCFELSDHADWPGLLQAIEATGAERVLTLHGRGETLCDHLRRRGIEARPIFFGPS